MYNSTIKALHVIFSNSYNPEDPASSFSETPVHKMFLTYAKHEIIIQQNDPVKYFYFLLKGKASVINSISWTRGDMVDTLTPLDILGLVEHLNDIPTYTAFVVAETPCVVMRISVEQYISIITQHADLCYETLRTFGRVAQTNMDRAETNSIFHPQDRLAHYLFLEAQKKLPYTCPLTRKELADSLYINLRTLYRYLSAMEKDGYLTLERGKIIIRKEHFEKLNERYGSIVL